MPRTPHPPSDPQPCKTVSISRRNVQPTARAVRLTAYDSGESTARRLLSLTLRASSREDVRQEAVAAWSQPRVGRSFVSNELHIDLCISTDCQWANEFLVMEVPMPIKICQVAHRVGNFDLTGASIGMPGCGGRVSQCGKLGRHATGMRSELEATPKSSANYPARVLLRAKHTP